jgi:hypothetical protein
MWKRVVTLCLLGTSVLLAADKQDETYHLKNGRFWNVMPSEVRPYFLTGILEGWSFHQSRAAFITVKEARAFSTTATFTVGDLENMLTSVYGDPENLELPIAWAMMACDAVQRGETTRDAAFMALRKALSDELKRQEPHPANELDPLDVILKSRPK